MTACCLVDRQIVIQMMTAHAVLKCYAASCTGSFFISADLFYGVEKRPLAAVEVSDRITEGCQKGMIINTL
jgi:hypothetical protein